MARTYAPGPQDRDTKKAPVCTGAYHDHQKELKRESKLWPKNPRGRLRACQHEAHR
jgi:hypothetical protein